MSPVEVLLIRHAHAGKRGSVDDDLRMLSEKGRRQAELDRKSTRLNSSHT